MGLQYPETSKPRNRDLQQVISMRENATSFFVTSSVFEPQVELLLCEIRIQCEKVFSHAKREESEKNKVIIEKS